MSTTTLLILIGAGVVVLLIAIIIFSKISSANKAKKIQDSIKKLKEEKQDFEQVDSKISLPEEPSTFEEKSVEEVFIPSAVVKNVVNDEDIANKGGLVEDYIQDQSVECPKTEGLFDKNDFDIPDSDNDFEYKPNQPVEDDFEKFMNEHSFSRKVFNKPLLERIKKLPPDIRMLILGNVLDRIDD